MQGPRYSHCQRPAGASSATPGRPGCSHGGIVLQILLSKRIPFANSCSWHQEEALVQSKGWREDSRFQNPPELQQLVPLNFSSVPASDGLFGGTHLSPWTGIGMGLAQTAQNWVTGPKNLSSAAFPVGQGPGMKGASCSSRSFADSPPSLPHHLCGGVLNREITESH